MGYKEAVEDGIIIKDEIGRRTLFQIPCEKCGSLITKTQYRRGQHYICIDCDRQTKKRIKHLESQLRDGDTSDKYEIRFEKASQNIIDAYGESEIVTRSIKIAKNAMDRFGSIPEATLAIALLMHKIKIIPQQKIGKYRVDFALPSFKCIIEVDGEIYHRDAEKDMRREAIISTTIGYDWKIIHIPASAITSDVKNVMFWIGLVLRGQIEEYDYKLK